MPDPRRKTRARAAAAPHPDGQATSARRDAPKKAGNGSPRGAPRPEETGNGTPRRRVAEREPSEGPEVALRGLLCGLRTGDLETVLLTVAMAADENRMPCADPDEEARILAFLARLAEHDAMLPPSPPPRPAGSGAGPGGLVQGLRMRSRW